MRPALLLLVFVVIEVHANDFGYVQKDGVRLEVVDYVSVKENDRTRVYLFPFELTESEKEKAKSTPFVFSLEVTGQERVPHLANGYTPTASLSFQLGEDGAVRTYGINVHHLEARGANLSCSGPPDGKRSFKYLEEQDQEFELRSSGSCQNKLSWDLHIGDL